jgi:hypothetical protein
MAGQGDARLVEVVDERRSWVVELLQVEVDHRRVLQLAEQRILPAAFGGHGSPNASMNRAG